MKNLIILCILCSAVEFGNSQETTESSGDMFTSIGSIFASSDVLNSESSGEGPITVVDEFHSINITDFDDSPNFNISLNNDEIQTLNETQKTTVSSASTPSVEETTPSTTKITTESTTISTTEMPTTITTSTTTTTVLITTSTVPTTSTMPSTTSTSIPATTQKSTTQRTPTTTTKTTKMPTIIPYAKPRDDEVPCEFNKEELVCDVELNCFGEGTIDCNLEEDESSMSGAPRPSLTLPLEEPTEYEDDEKSTSIGYFPSELVGRVPPRFSFPWHMKSIDAEIPDPLTEPTTIITESSKSTPTSTLSVTSSEISETTKTPFEFASSSSTTMTETFSQTAFQSTEISTSTDNKKISDEASTLHIENATSMMLGISNVTEASTPGIPISLLATNTESITTRYNNTEDTSEHVAETRVKRDSTKKGSPSFSESLKLTIEDSDKRSKTCKVTGNLHCVHMPSTGFCKGKGTCRIISVEKSEKPTSSKGVENWAIAVIAICATAAALTIGLLVYLVVTSWKKLKVQPQNGVTTLNYVNSTSP